MTDFSSANGPGHRKGDHGGYEAADVHVGGTMKFFAWFIFSVAVILVVVWYFQIWLGNLRPAAAPLPRPVSLVPSLQPSPKHPTLAWEDMAALRSSQDAQLHSSGPVAGDPKHQHLPIDQAIDDLLHSGVLTRPWKNPTTYPYQRPPAEKYPALPNVENRT